MYPKGARVVLFSMNDPYTNLKQGDLGTVDMVDSTGTIFINWDNGSTLGAVYEADVVRVLPASMDETVIKQIMAVRATGETNMFDTNAVQRLAFNNEFYELVNFIETDRKAYSRFILTGE
jgi:hypothetical protein